MTNVMIVILIVLFPSYQVGFHEETYLVLGLISADVCCSLHFPVQVASPNFIRPPVQWLLEILVAHLQKI
ncbi:hypothetical protein RB195_020098 [Necator americanus]|uniref:Secreted protein n=1 Tax=Necator americanus TaxID=51031 RepID=A0ABR1CIS9_NECAM